MIRAKNGDTVGVHYTGKLKDGSVFDSSRNRKPLEFTLESDKIIPGFERGIIGMQKGETKTLTLPSEEAYGSDEAKIYLAVPRNQFPTDVQLNEGQTVQLRQANGSIVAVTVWEMREETIILSRRRASAGGKDADLRRRIDGYPLIPSSRRTAGDVAAPARSGTFRPHSPSTTARGRRSHVG